MAKTYLATKQEVQTVSDDVTTINSQINTPSTGIDARVQATEAFGTRITTSEADIVTLEDQMNNPTTGIVKQLLDIDNDINEEDVGIKARIADLEQGGTSVTKFRTHSPSGKYEDGEVVQKNKALYEANSAIDGSSTSVPFVVGAGANSWTPIDQKDPSTPLVFQTSSSGALTVMSPSGDGVYIQSLSNNVSGNSIGFQVDADRGRLTYMTNGVQAEMEPDDMLRVSDADERYAAKPEVEKIQQAHFVLASSTDNSFTDAFTHNGFKFEVRNFMTSITRVKVTKERTENIITIWKSTSGSIVASNTTEFAVINWSGHADTEKMRYINVTVCDKDSNKVLHKYDITTADITNSGNGQDSISIVSQAFA